MVVNLEVPQKPIKPFDGYKWRWATLTPTEGLNDPAVYIGVLRALFKHQGESASSPSLKISLQTVQDETHSTVQLARSADRNLMRNSQQYWKALGVLENTSPIRLSPFGIKLCRGEITPAEFSATVIKTLTLPNAYIEDNVSAWVASGLQIKPLELVLDIVAKLFEISGAETAYITADELILIVIPLAGVNTKLIAYCSALIAYRQGILDVSGWPKCTPAANDKRMAKEFLLFLCSYGYLEEISVYNSVVATFEKRFALRDISLQDIADLASLPNLELDRIDDAIGVIRDSDVPSLMDRRRVTREFIERPGQQVFRRNVLAAASKKCAVTGVSVETVLQAAHIIPAAKMGNDDKSNGLCLRSDIHILFDNGLLRIHPEGDIKLAPHVIGDECYATLPTKIMIPPYVNPANLDWRLKYT